MIRKQWCGWVSLLFVGLPLACSGGQTGDEPNLLSRCLLLAEEEVAWDQVSSLGFAPATAFGQALGERTLPYQPSLEHDGAVAPSPFDGWPDLQESELTLNVSAAENVARLQHWVDPLIRRTTSDCHALLTTRVNVDVQSSAGKLNEHASGTLVTEFSDQAVLESHLEFDELSSQFATQRSARLGTLTLHADLNPYGAWGSLSARWLQGDTSVYSYFGTFGGDSCGVPESIGQTLRVELGRERTGVLRRMGRDDTAYPELLARPPVGSVTAWLESDDGLACYSATQHNVGPRFWTSGVLHLRLDDGSELPSFRSGAAASLQPDGTLAGLYSGGPDECSHPQSAESLLAHCGDFGFDLRGFRNLFYMVSLETESDQTLSGEITAWGAYGNELHTRVAGALVIGNAWR